MEIMSNALNEKALLLFNHHTELDWLFSWMLIEPFGSLGYGRALAKKLYKYVPTVGWAWALNDFIFLERDWNRDKKVIRQTIRELSSYPYSVWLLLFAEGTRLTPEKLLLSQKFAKENNLPVLKHHLIPRFKGFSELIRGMDTSKFIHIYDATVGLHSSKSGPATISSILMGNQMVVDIFLRRFDRCDIPKTDEGAKYFLMNRYKEKDDLLDFYKSSNGKTFTSYHVPVNTLPKSLGVLLNTIILNAVICIPLAYKTCAILMSGNFAQISTVLVVLAALHLAMKTLIDLTKISKASNYGN